MPEILDLAMLDRKMLVTNLESVLAMRDLLRREGIWVGVSCGAAMHVARKVAAELEPDRNVVTVFADGGARYASAGLYADRDEDELEEILEERVWW